MNDKKFIKGKIRKSLKSLLGTGYLNKHELHRLEVLSSMVSGILKSGRSEISQIALSSNEGRKKHTSQKKQFKRFIENRHFTYESHYMPFAKGILESLSQAGELVLIVDGSGGGRKCTVLMFSVLYKKKALPIVWHVHQGKKGHLPEQAHRDLLAAVAALVPAACKVTVLGDGEFDGCEWQADIVAQQWDYVLRTGGNLEVEEEQGDVFKLSWLGVDEQESFFVENVKFSQKRYGPVNVLMWHEKGYKDPILLVTNLGYPPHIQQFYKKRVKIEPFFRDQKSKGFHIQRSGLSHPERLEKLLIACCLAYIFCILGGIKATKSKFYSRIAEQQEQALSLFQLGLRFIRFLVDIRQWRAFSWKHDLALHYTNSDKRVHF